MITGSRMMLNTLNKILEGHGKTKDFNSGSFYLKIQNDPYMPLSIERHDTKVVFTHYYKQNGDLVPDPDVEFYFINNTLIPIAIQDSFGYSVSVKINEGRLYVKRSTYRAHVDFVNMWAKSLLSQGFHNPKNNTKETV